MIQQLDILIRRGRELRAGDTGDSASLRIWQRDVGTLVTELSGGSKAHWLARAFSEAFLVRAEGRVTTEVGAAEILDRLLATLERARAAIVEADGLVAAPPDQAPRARRFDFVHNADLRPVLEAAYAGSRRALEAQQFGESLMLSCGVLEAIVTDALEHAGAAALAGCEPPPGAIAGWPFEARVRVAERAGVIRGGCARLPAVAWRYREAGGMTISEREARVAGQVLHVIMRDLDPGR